MEAAAGVQEVAATSMMSLALRCTLDSFSANLRPYIRTILRQIASASPENAAILSNFIIAEQNIATLSFASNLNNYVQEMNM
jgi:hypothetical protein